MSILLVLGMLFMVCVLLFSDKIIEHFAPEGDMAKSEHEFAGILNDEGGRDYSHTN